MFRWALTSNICCVMFFVGFFYLISEDVANIFKLTVSVDTKICPVFLQSLYAVLCDINQQWTMMKLLFSHCTWWNYSMKCLHQLISIRPSLCLYNICKFNVDKFIWNNCTVYNCSFASQVWFQNRRSKERRMKQLSALGARRHAFFRGPRRMRPLGGRLEDPDILGPGGYSYYGGMDTLSCSTHKCKHKECSFSQNTYLYTIISSVPTHLHSNLRDFLLPWTHKDSRSRYQDGLSTTSEVYRRIPKAVILVCWCISVVLKP